MDFQQKARFLNGGHPAEAPNSITCYSVIPHGNICIGFLLSSLHGVEINTIYMGNENLNLLCVENIWFVGDDECGEDKSRVLLIVHALYGLNLQVSRGDHP